MVHRWYKFFVPSMNVLADSAQPMLLVFPASSPSDQQILETVSALVVYSVRCAINFCKMQTMLLEELSSTENALPPDCEGESSLFANGTPVIPAAVKAPDKRFEETTKQAKKIEKRVRKQKAKQGAKQAAKASSSVKAHGKMTSASSQRACLMESPFPFPAPDENPQHDTIGLVAGGAPKSKVFQSKASPSAKPSAGTSQPAPVPKATAASTEVQRKTRGVKRPRSPVNTQEEPQTGHTLHQF